MEFDIAPQNNQTLTTSKRTFACKGNYPNFCSHQKGEPSARTVEKRHKWGVVAATPCGGGTGGKAKVRRSVHQTPKGIEDVDAGLPGKGTGGGHVAVDMQKGGAPSRGNLSPRSFFCGRRWVRKEKETPGKRKKAGRVK